MQLSGLPKLVDLIPDWHAEARCAIEPDQKLTEQAFFQEHALFAQLSDRHAMASPSTLLGLLLCAECPVRRQCLTTALTPWRWTTKEDGRRGLTRDDRENIGRTFGTWGGSVELERHLLRDLPAGEAADILERTFPERLKARLDAYWDLRNELHPHPTRPGEQRLRPLRKADRRIDELLAKRQVKTSQLGPGPGRGNKGPIALYAERHGVSRSTAWRRLRAA